MKKILRVAPLLALALGLGVGLAGTSRAAPGCWGDCYDLRYECRVSCGANNQCKSACDQDFQYCLSHCPG
jgi:hypothetical protein